MGIIASFGIRDSFVLAPLLSSNPETAPGVIHLSLPPISSHTPSQHIPIQGPRYTKHSPSILSTLIPPCLYTYASWCLWHSLPYMENSFHRCQREHLSKGSGSMSSFKAWLLFAETSDHPYTCILFHALGRIKFALTGRPVNLFLLQSTFVHIVSPINCELLRCSVMSAISMFCLPQKLFVEDINWSRNTIFLP